jgi:predicted NACHT family NTPase
MANTDKFVSHRPTDLACFIFRFLKRPLLDGLDELSASDRTNVLTKINKFAARFQQSSFLLTVRDSTALTVPLGVPVLALTRLDDAAIEKFANAYSKHGGRLSADDLRMHLQRHPDLGHLLRIPLFLALVLASIQPGSEIPRSRSELLENYLSLLFSPERYKSITAPMAILGDIRQASELLAWRGLESDGIGILEIEAKRLLKGLSPAPFREPKELVIDLDQIP